MSHKEDLQQGEDEVTDYAVATPFTHKCNRCGAKIAVIDGVPDAHDCSA